MNDKPLSVLRGAFQHTVICGLLLFSAAFCAPVALAQQSADGEKLNRTALPIPEPQYPHSTVLDVRNATPPPRFEVKAPAGAPNVLIVLIDDMGFGQSSAFGGPINMPTVDRLANERAPVQPVPHHGALFPDPWRLLTGRNHHMGNTGSIMETATAFPGNTGQRPESVAPLAMMLRYNGYTTAHFGKNHETAAWEVSPSGPTDRWPTRSGFDKFYGFMGGETNQWAPAIYDGMTKIEVPKDPNYHFMTDMTNQAIKWMQLGEVPHAGQAFLHLLRAGRHPRAAPRAQGMDRQVQGQVRPGLGQTAGRDPRPPDQAGRGAGGHEARAEAGSDQGLGQADR